MSLIPFIKAGVSLVPGAGRLPFLPGGGGEIPETKLSLEGVSTDFDRLAAYSQVCGFTLRETLPATWPHVQAFGLHMELMTSGAFPFSPVGVVHIANSISQYRPIAVSETYDLRVRATPLVPHRSGRSFSLLTEARIGEELIWEGRSTMLRRGGGGNSGGDGQKSQPVPENAVVVSGSNGTDPTKTGEGASEGRDRGRADAIPVASHWKLPGDLGARYAGVSGDSNPIHMHALTAKAFGFPRAIAHGMWTKARCLAAMESQLPEAYTVEVRFGKPILLPGRVGFGCEAGSEGAIDFAVSGKEGRIHLEGHIR